MLVGNSLHRRAEFKHDVVWSVLRKVIQSNPKFGLTRRLELHFDHVKLCFDNGRVNSTGRSLDVMSAIKRSIVVVKVAVQCLVYALIIAVTRINGDPKYESFRHGRLLTKPVEDLLLILPMA
jgi:hypothetical protein